MVYLEVLRRDLTPCLPALSSPYTHVQVSVHCVERGELLAQVRNRYSDLLSRVPQEIKRCTHTHSRVIGWSGIRTSNHGRLMPSPPHTHYHSLHDELLAQRALDRRLTEELTCFKDQVELVTQ